MLLRATKTSEAAHEYVGRLRKNGMTILGSGHFSTVLGKPKEPYVIRVNTGDDYDKGWAEFVSNLKKWDKAKNNPHFAKYGAVRKFRHDKTGDPYLVGEVERLYQSSTIDYYTMSSMLDNIISQVNGYRNLGDRKKRVPYIPMSMYEAVEFLVDIQTANKALRFDMQECNIMTRKNGDLVITDPFSYDISSPVVETDLISKSYSGLTYD